jgi:hypothetical protein
MATKLGQGLSYSPEVKQAIVTYADTTAAELFTLPANSYIVDLFVDVQTAFAGGTTTLDIGTYGTANHFADDVDVSGTGRATVTLTNACEDLGGSPLAVYTTVAAGNSSGIANITVVFFTLSHSHLH